MGLRRTQEFAVELLGKMLYDALSVVASWETSKNCSVW